MLKLTPCVPCFYWGHPPGRGSQAGRPTLRQRAIVRQEKCGMLRACFRQYAKSAQPRAWRSAWTMRARMGSQ